MTMLAPRSLPLKRVFVAQMGAMEMNHLVIVIIVFSLIKNIKKGIEYPQNEKISFHSLFG